MSHWSRRYAVPFFVTSLVAFVVTATALVVVLVARQPTRAEGADCLIGTWRAVSYWQMDPALELGRLELVGDGHVYEFRNDGTGSADFGDRTILRGDVLGAPIELIYTGRVTFRYTAADGAMRFADQQSRASVTLGDLPIDEVVILVDEPFRYRCEGDVLFLSRTGDFEGEYSRLS